MIMLIIQKVTVVVLLALLVFNLTQRRHLHHGEGKRFASLYLAGFVLFFYGATIVFRRFDVGPIYLLAVLAIEAFVLYALRDRVFIFRTQCASCGIRLPLSRVLYVESSFCVQCESEIEAAAQSALGSATMEEETPRRVEDVDWDRWVPAETAVLCFVRDGDRLLLIEKKRGLGAGKVNGPGGRIEPGEIARDAAARETREEVMVDTDDLSQRAELSFVFSDGYSLKCFVFFAKLRAGEPTETDEARPFWCAVDEIPYDRMWADDRFWLPRVLRGDYVIGRFIFEGDTLLSQEIVGT